MQTSSSPQLCHQYATSGRNQPVTARHGCQLEACGRTVTRRLTASCSQAHAHRRMLCCLRAGGAGSRDQLRAPGAPKLHAVPEALAELAAEHHELLGHAAAQHARAARAADVRGRHAPERQLAHRRLDACRTRLGSPLVRLHCCFSTRFALLLLQQASNKIRPSHLPSMSSTADIKDEDPHLPLTLWSGVHLDDSTAPAHHMWMPQSVRRARRRCRRRL